MSIETAEDFLVYCDFYAEVNNMFRLVNPLLDELSFPNDVTLSVEDNIAVLTATLNYADE